MWITAFGDPTVVVEVQVRQRDHVDVVGVHADGRELVDQGAPGEPFDRERPDSGVDQRGLLARDHERADREPGLAVVVREPAVVVGDAHEVVCHREDAVGDAEHPPVADPELGAPVAHGSRHGGEHTLRSRRTAGPRSPEPAPGGTR
jgi:hypothetical protein